jgi:hypothetical protein
MFIAMPVDGFSYTQGTPSQFTRSDLARAITREFCPTCGTHVAARVPGRPIVVVKVGSLDDPSVFQPQMAIFTIDKQAFHQIPEGVPTFGRLPQR